MTIRLSLIGIGTGNPDHVTAQAVAEINAAELILLPRKGPEKADLADLRREILDRVLVNAATRVIEFDLPERATGHADYAAGVGLWHDAIAAAWTVAMAEVQPAPRRVALLVWGDPSLFDSTLRVAARLDPAPRLRVIPGISALHALTAAHAIPLNRMSPMLTIPTSLPPSSTGRCRTRRRVITSIASGTVVPGPAVCSSRVISCPAVIAKAPAPSRARLPTMSRSLTIPNTWSAMSSTSTAPIRRSASNPATSATVTVGATRATSPPFCFRIAAIVMARSRADVLRHDAPPPPPTATTR